MIGAFASYASADYSVTIKFKTSGVGAGLTLDKVIILGASACGGDIELEPGKNHYNVAIAREWSQIKLQFSVNNADLGCDALRDVTASVYELCPSPKDLGYGVVDQGNDYVILGPCNVDDPKEGEFAVVVWYADTKKGGQLKNVPIRTAWSTGPAPAAEEVNFCGGWKAYDPCATYTVQIDATIRVRMNVEIITANATLKEATSGKEVAVSCWIENNRIIVVQPLKPLKKNTEYILTIEGQDCVQGYKDC
jgi:hypothetical protein